MRLFKAIWRGFSRFWHDQITTPNGDVDGARVGLLIILFGAGAYIYFEWYALVMKAQAWDPNAFGDGLIKVGGAILTAAAAVQAKSGSEVPYNPSIAAANFPNDPGVQAAVSEGVDAAQQTVNTVSSFAQSEITQAQSITTSLRQLWCSIKHIFR
ncbi:MAG: hypothetical protein P4L77_11675 [Sulfuriferula sp.]|nr:hypothetical protein [Sulfuriferula sp.]